jgi:hypothetical protein
MSIWVSILYDQQAKHIGYEAKTLDDCCLEDLQRVMPMYALQNAKTKISASILKCGAAEPSVQNSVHY